MDKQGTNQWSQLQMTIPMAENRKESDEDKIATAKGVAKGNKKKFLEDKVFLQELEDVDKDTKIRQNSSELLVITKTKKLVAYVITITEKSPKKFRAVFMESVISVDYALNTVVIKCHTGMANAACASLDTMAEMEGIVGTLAGDDTIFVLMRTEEMAEHLTARIENMISLSE